VWLFSFEQTATARLSDVMRSSTAGRWSDGRRMGLDPGGAQVVMRCGTAPETQLYLNW
jgi:hypothetical protein